MNDETSLIFVMVRARLYDSVMTLKMLTGKLCCGVLALGVKLMETLSHQQVIFNLTIANGYDKLLGILLSFIFSFLASLLTLVNVINSADVICRHVYFENRHGK